MTSLSRRVLLGRVALAAGAAMIGRTAFAQVIVVPAEPPPLRTEVIPVLPPDRVEVVHWQPGYWRWNGVAHEWVPGRHVERPRPGAAWVPARWERRPSGWVFIEGHWS